MPSRCTSGAGRPVARATRSACSSPSSVGRTSSPSSRTPTSHVRWLSPRWSSSIRSGSTSSTFAKWRWKTIAALQRPTALWPASSSAFVDDADGVREVDDPRVRRSLARALGDVEHDRHRAERLREAAEARRLLADAAARDRHRLVDHARRLAADADLDQDGVGALDRLVEARRRVQARRVRGAVEHALREPRHDREPLLVRVVQVQVVDRHQVDAAARSRRSPRACTSSRRRRPRASRLEPPVARRGRSAP